LRFSEALGQRLTILPYQKRGGGNNCFLVDVTIVSAWGNIVKTNEMVSLRNVKCMWAQCS
jgi:hypothetical protein